MDVFNGKGLDDKGDGVLVPGAMSMPSWLISNIFSKDTIKMVVELALAGEI